MFTKIRNWILSNAYEITAQLAHFAWGAYVPYKLAQHQVPLLIGCLVSAIAFAGKESIESIWGVWEPKQPWASGAIDYAFFLLGILSLKI